MTKIMNEEGYKETYNEDYVVCEYGSLENNPLCNIDLNMFIIRDMSTFTIDGMLKLMGKPSARMIGKTIFHISGRYTSHTSESYTYTLDSEGFVMGIMESWYGGGDVYTIEYL